MSRVLATRMLTAAAIVPIVIGVVTWAPTWTVAILFGLFVVAGAWEWSQLTGLARRARPVFVLSVLGLICVLFLALRERISLAPVLGLAVAWWAGATAWVIAYQAGRGATPVGSGMSAWAIGWLVLVPSWLAVVVLHASSRGPALVLLLLCVVWGADTGAYFAGKRFGRRKLASRVSPGKTWEGGLGAAVAVVPIGLLGGWYLGLLGGELAWFVVLCLLVVPVSIVGDLTESLFKRHAGVKDSGVLMPGHGGVLDRIDSLTAAAPFFVLGWSLIGALG